MIDLAVGLRIVIIGVLSIAAFAKATTPTAASRAAEDLGVPTSWAPAVSRTLPIAEVTAAVLLMAGTTAWAGAIASALLFTAFTALVGWNLIRGRRPHCNCFGSLSTQPISGRTVARNLALLAIALLLVSIGPSRSWPGLPAWWITLLIDRLSIRQVVPALALLAIAEGAAIVVLLRKRAPAPAAATALPAEAREPTSGWPIGTRAPRFDLESSSGNRVSLDAVLDSRPALLLFTDSGCAPCEALMPEIAHWQESLSDQLAVLVLAQGDREVNAAKAERFGLTVLHEGNRSVGRSYRYVGTPGAVLVSQDGRILSETVGGASGVRELVERAVRLANDTPPAHVVRQAEPRRLVIGDPAPPLHLTGRTGESASLDSYVGELLLVLFWGPECGFCREFLPDVLGWEQKVEGVQLVVVSSAPSDEPFRANVLIDVGFVNARAFGVAGTPSAILIDAVGTVASDLAVGAEEITDLMDRASRLARVAADLAGLRSR